MNIESSGQWPSSARVAVLEDLKDRGHALRDMLLEERFDVECVETARGALGMLNAGLRAGSAAPDLVICNARMLGETGLELLARWCRVHPETAVVFVSAFTSPKLRARMARVPVSLVLDQDFSLEDVRNVARVVAESLTAAWTAPA